MKERPILFSGPMVRAILEGRKTMTRRVVKPEGAHYLFPFLDLPGNQTGEWAWCSSSHVVGKHIHCPYGQVGDRLWVRENFCPIYPQDPHYNGGRPIEYDYAATYQHGYRLGDLIGEKKKWKPSIHMPRIASRILLDITGVRVERLHEISEADAQAEGVERVVAGVGWRRYCDPDSEEVGVPPCGDARRSFRSLWKLINGDESWNANPWVWVVEFKRVQP